MVFESSLNPRVDPVVPKKVADKVDLNAKDSPSELNVPEDARNETSDPDLKALEDLPPPKRQQH
jgi:hypothetical protein